VDRIINDYQGGIPLKKDRICVREGFPVTTVWLGFDFPSIWKQHSHRYGMV